MDKNKNFFIAFFFLLFSVSTFLFVADANAAGYTLLEKIPGFASANGSDLPGYITAIYNVALAVVVLSAVLMVSVGGFMYLTSAGNTSTMGTAKGIIFDALIGLVIALAAWLLLNVINPDLVNLTINGLSTVPVAPSVGTGTAAIPVPATGQYSNTNAVAALQAAGISVTSSGNCSDPNISTCTSLEGIPQSTIANIIKLKADSSCSFGVTGGTEVGHDSHGPGKPIVDISENACIKAYLTNVTGQNNIASICATAANQSVAINCTYKEPKAHFHLVFKS